LHRIRDGDPRRRVWLGGSGSSGSGGGSTRAATVPPSTVAHKHKPTKHQLMSDALWKFLRDVRPIRAWSNHAGDQANVFIDKIVNVCCADWPQTAAAIRHAGKVERDAADRLAAIRPPRRLKEATSRTSTVTATTHRSTRTSPPSSLPGKSFDWSTYDSRWTAREAPVTRIRITLIQYAAVNRLSLPAWVHNIGGK